jgi:N-carbamoylputrescine amidase
VDASTRIGLVQMRMSEDRAENLETAARLARSACEQGARIVALPELFATPYFCQRQDRAFLGLAEPVPGPTTKFLGTLAAELGAVILGSVFESVEVGFSYNTAVVLERDGTLLGRSRKMHIPQYPHYEEKFYFTPGDTDYPVFATSAGRIAVPTCWDQWYPEAARIACLKGAELIVYPTAIGHSRVLDAEYRAAWQRVMQGHAVANALYVAAVNRVGTEGDLRFWGSSFLADPFGTIVAEGGEEEEVVMGAVEPARITHMRELNHYFRDRRPESYGPLAQRYLGA